MSFQTLDFKCALITGGGGGIGFAMAEYLISQSKKVIIAGRTESKLQQAVQELQLKAPNKDDQHKVSYYVLDTGDIPSIEPFCKKLISEHPELDCLINNAGVQRPLDVNEMKPEEFLQKADQEIAINISGPMHLALTLLPHLRSKQPGAVIMNVSSVLGYIPTSIINPVYNGTKAWLHFFSLNLRTQLQKGDGNVKVIEIVPPTVSTDLHRERADPDDNKKSKNQAALSVAEFMEDLVAGWKEGKETIGAGTGKKVVDRWFGEFGEDYSKAASA